jgi:hypothetical protein
VVEHCNGAEEPGDAVSGELDGVIVAVFVLAGAAVAPEEAVVPEEPQAAGSKAIEARQHAASIRRPVIADAPMANILFI